MKLAIAVETNETPIVAEHFGRCTGFQVYHIDENKNIVNQEFLDNPLGAHGGGTCQLPHFVNSFSANVVIAGGMGQKAISLFQEYGIEVITAPGLDVKNVLNQFLAGDLAGYEECKNHSHEC